MDADNSVRKAEGGGGRLGRGGKKKKMGTSVIFKTKSKQTKNKINKMNNLK